MNVKINTCSCRNISLIHPNFATSTKFVSYRRISIENKTKNRTTVRLERINRTANATWSKELTKRAEVYVKKKQTSQRQTSLPRVGRDRHISSIVWWRPRVTVFEKWIECHLAAKIEAKRRRSGVCRERPSWWMLARTKRGTQRNAEPECWCDQHAAASPYIVSWSVPIISSPLCLSHSVSVCVCVYVASRDYPLHIKLLYK